LRLPQDSGSSTAPREGLAVQAILELQKTLKPQRLAQILGSLHYLLAFNTEAQDYHFLVAPIDRTTLTGRRIEQLEQLINSEANGAVQVVSMGNLLFSAYRCGTMANPRRSCSITLPKQAS
jgi:hypothetical protein